MHWMVCMVEKGPALEKTQIKLPSLYYLHDHGGLRVILYSEKKNSDI